METRLLVNYSDGFCLCDSSGLDYGTSHSGVWHKRPTASAVASNFAPDPYRLPLTTYRLPLAACRSYCLCPTSCGNFVGPNETLYSESKRSCPPLNRKTSVM